MRKRGLGPGRLGNKAKSHKSCFSLCYCIYLCVSPAGHTDVLRNKTAQPPAQRGVFGLSQPETPPQPSHAHGHRDTPVTLPISHLKVYKQPSPIAEEGGDWDIHRRSTDVDQIMPYTYSNSVLWDSWISDFNDDDDDSSEHVCVCVCVCVCCHIHLKDYFLFCVQ